jgi:type I restriction enzyme, R subunit
MQAIARANRVYEGKNNGLLIDYNGILTNLRAALARYSRAEVGSTDESITPYNDLNHLQEDYALALQTCIDHLANLGFDLQELLETEGFDKIAALPSAVNAVSTNDESRARFEVLAREVFKKKQPLITEPKLTSGKVMVPNCQFHPKLADAKMRVILLLAAKLCFQVRQTYG